MDIEQIRQELDKLYEKIEEGMTSFSKEALTNASLDNRALSTNCSFSKDGILVPKEQVRALEYYGGFEYIHSEDKIDIGVGRFYSSSSDRVQEILDRLFNEEDEEEEQEHEQHHINPALASIIN